MEFGLEVSQAPRQMLLAILVLILVLMEFGLEV